MARSVDPKLRRHYGIALRECRKAAGLSQEALIERATKAGLEGPHRTFISALENGRQEPGLGTHFKLSVLVEHRPSRMLVKVEEMNLPDSELRRLDRSNEERIPLGLEKCPRCNAVYSRYLLPLKTPQRSSFKCTHCKQPLLWLRGTFRLIYETKRLPKVRQAK